jgi:hypothetical protein
MEVSIRGPSRRYFRGRRSPVRRIDDRKKKIGCA